MKKIVIVGAGGFGREVQWLLERLNKVKEEWELLGYIDDGVEKGTCINGLKVLGTTEDLKSSRKELEVACAIGNAAVRRKLVMQFKQNPLLKYPNLIDPGVIMSDRCALGEGVIICAGSILTVGIVIGNFVIINLDTTVGHDAVLDDYITIYPSVNISGWVKVGTTTEIGTGTQIIQQKVIGHHSIIGAGSVVIRDIPDCCTAVGNPAKPIKFHME